MSRILLAVLAALALATTNARAVVSVGLNGSAILTFDTLPGTNDWSCSSIVGGAVNFVNREDLDAAVQTNTAAGISLSLMTSSGSPPPENRIAQWSSSGQYIQSRANGSAAGLLMARLRNDTGGNIYTFDVTYDLTVRADAPSQIPLRVYFSTNGAQNGWQYLNEFISSTQAIISVNAGVWPANSDLFLLWADDNSASDPEAAFGIDNFTIANVTADGMTCADIVAGPSSISVPERGVASFSIMATGAPKTFRWFRSDDGGLNYFQIPGASSSNFSVAAVTWPSDNGARFFATVSNSLCVDTSQVVVLTVEPDTVPPAVIRAVGEIALDTVTLKFSEPLNPETVTEQNFVLFETGTDPAMSPYLVFSATLSNATDVTLLTDAREQGGDYSLAIYDVRDNSSQTNLIHPNPTLVQLRHTLQLIGFDEDNVWRWTAQTNLFGTGWEKVNYDDSDTELWPQGFAGLGNDADNAVSLRTITDYAFNSAPQFFRRNFVLPFGTNGLELRMRHVFEDGAVVFINGQEAARINVNPGPLSVTTRAVVSSPVNVPIGGPVSLPFTNVFAGDNVIAVAVFQNGAASGDIFMALELIAEGPRPVCSCALRILVHPESQTVMEGQTFTLSVYAEGQVPISHQWYKDNVFLPGSTSSSFVIFDAQPSDAGDYFVVVSNSSGSVTSRVARITMGDPPEPPIFLSANWSSTTNISLHFSGLMAMASAQNPANYSVTSLETGALLPIFSASLTNGTNVILATAPRVWCRNFRVTITGVTDRATPPNSATPDSRIIMPVVTYSAPRIRIDHNANGQVTVRWFGCDEVLMEAHTIGNAATIWTNVPGNPNPYTLTPGAGGNRFFKLGR